MFLHQLIHEYFCLWLELIWIFGNSKNSASSFHWTCTVKYFCINLWLFLFVAETIGYIHEWLENKNPLLIASSTFLFVGSWPWCPSLEERGLCGSPPLQTVTPGPGLENKNIDQHLSHLKCLLSFVQFTPLVSVSRKYEGCIPQERNSTILFVHR